MRLTNRFLILILATLTAACSTPSQTADQTPEPTPGIREAVTETILQMPADAAEERQWLVERLVEAGPEGVRILAGMLTDPGTGDDTKARYALSSLAVHVSRPGADTEREWFESALLKELERQAAPGGRRFLVDLLEHAGSDRAVPVLGRLLDDPRLFEPALRQLAVIGSAESSRALRDALATEEDSGRQAARIRTLGDLQDEAAVSGIRPAAESDEEPVREAVRYALAEIGDPADQERFLAYADSGDRETGPVAVRYATRLQENGYSDESLRIYRAVLESEAEQPVRLAALTGRVEIEGEAMTGELLDLAGSDNRTVRSTVLGELNRMEGEEITRALVSQLDHSNPDVRADLLHALGERGDALAADGVRRSLEDDSGRVRGQAARALFELEGEEALAAVLDRLLTAEEESERSLYRETLLRMPTDRLTDEAVEALAEADQANRAVLIRILAERRDVSALPRMAEYAGDADREVRSAVYDAFAGIGGRAELDRLTERMDRGSESDEMEEIVGAAIAIMNREVAEEQRASAADAMWQVAGEEERRVMLAESWRIDRLPARWVDRRIDDVERPAREAAYASLAAWRYGDGLEVLADRIADAPEEWQVELAQGYVRLVLLEAPDEREQAAMLHELTGRIGSPGVTAQVVRLFPDASDAFAPLLTDEVRSYFLEEVVAEDGEPEESAGETAEEPVYGELFNGENLDGWEAVGQNPDSWGVEDGILYTDGVGSGWLATEGTYDDFEMELEFRVPEAGNSGVFLRAPREGNPAFAGMEIQILDDYAEQYADLEPYQYSGSIYNVKAPSARVTRPAGEWQTMRIRAAGSRIRVWINGEMILGTDLVRHMDQVQEHPGLVRRSGYVGLQNHSARVDFRNIRIRPVTRE